MNFKNDLVIGVDASTTACKALILDLKGNPVAIGRTSIPARSPQPAWHEQSADDWWVAMRNSLRDASSQIDISRLAAICICSQRETFVPVNETGQPIRNAILWMDERARGLLPVIENAMGLEEFHHITGKPLSGNLTVAKILWLKENEPAVFESAAKFLDVAAFLNHKLTGEFVTGWGIADPTGMFDMQQDQWSQPILTLLNLTPDHMPVAFRAGSQIGKISAVAAQACGIPEGLPVIAGLGDGQATSLGANITQSGQTYLSLGTSVVSGTLSENYLIDRAFRSMYAVAHTYSLETVILGGTFTLEWLREKFSSGASLAELELQSREIPPGAENLIVVPYWNSAMNPYWDAYASGISIGWHGCHGPAHFYRAILEGIAYELRLHFEGVQKALKQEIQQLVAMGGGARSELWCQIIADVSGKTVRRAEISEASALGAGILAAVGAGLYEDFQRAARIMTRPPSDTVEPDPQNHEFYSRVFKQVYLPLFPRLQPILRNLAQI